MGVFVTFVRTVIEDVVFNSIRWKFFVLTGVNRDYVGVLLCAFENGLWVVFCETFLASAGCIP